MITYTETNILNSPYTNYVKIPFTKKHSHTYWEITVVLDGSVTHVINGKQFKQTAGSVTILRPLKDAHYFIVESKDAMLYRHRDLYVSELDMQKWCDCLSSNLHESLSQSEFPHIFYAPSPLINHIESTFLSPNFESANNPVIYKNLLFSIVVTLLSHMQASQISAAPPPWITNLIQALRNPENFTLSIEDLTGNIPYSHCHICREFKKYVGQTVVSFFIKQKINYASYLLVNTNLKIIDIANSVGYDSPKNFINQFNTIFSLSPSEWRAKNQILMKK